MVECKPSFVQLDTRACLDTAKAVGIDTSKTVDMRLELDGPGETYISAGYWVDAKAMARIMESLQTISVKA